MECDSNCSRAGFDMYYDKSQVEKSLFEICNKNYPFNKSMEECEALCTSKFSVHEYALNVKLCICK